MAKGEKVVGRIKKVDLKRIYADEGLEHLWSSPSKKNKIKDSSTDNYCNFYIWAVYSKKPPIDIPPEWVKSHRQYFNQKPSEVPSPDNPEFFYVLAKFGWDWSSKKQKWDLLRAGHNLLHYIKESDPELIEAYISNSID